MCWDSDGEVSLSVRDFFVALATLEPLAALLRLFLDTSVEKEESVSLSVCLEPTEDDLEGRGDLDRTSLRMEATAAIACLLYTSPSPRDS